MSKNYDLFGRCTQMDTGRRCVTARGHFNSCTFSEPAESEHKTCEHKLIDVVAAINLPTISVSAEWCRVCGSIRETLDGPTGPIVSPWRIPEAYKAMKGVA